MIFNSQGWNRAGNLAGDSVIQFAAIPGQDWLSQHSFFDGQSLIKSIASPLQDWLSQHPIVSWLTQHPLWLLALIILLIFLFSGLLGAISRLTEKIWLTLLRSPFQVMGWIFSGTWALLKAITGLKAEAKPAQPDPQIRLTELLDRLDAIRQEQDEVLQEVRSILAGKEPNQVN